MCLAVPAKIIQIEDGNAQIDVNGVRRRVSLYLTPEARQGDYVLLHAGFAIKVLDQQEALNTLDLLKEIDATGR